MAWIYNQIGDNLTGILIILFGLGLWRALSPDVLGRIGAGALILGGLSLFLEGFFRLDCRGIDNGCTNDSWHSSAHKMDNRFLFVFFAAALILAFAFRRIPEWRSLWLPSLTFPHAGPGERSRDLGRRQPWRLAKQEKGPRLLHPGPP
jgi:Protein of unknown function (DUF998)